jgi:hypothetical protein
MEWGDAKPRVRAECKDAPRPCPWVSCRYNTTLDVKPGGGIILAGGRTITLKVLERFDFTDRIAEVLSESSNNCALDLAEGGSAMTLDEISSKLSVVRERVRQIEMGALKKLKRWAEVYR